MAADDILEQAPTSRSRCRQCRKEIEEGDYRFGSNWEGFYGDGAPSYAYFHVRCASQRMPDRLLPLLRKASAAVRDELDDYEKLLSACDKSSKKQNSKFPYGERAASGRAKCIKCEQQIAKDELRVAVEREIQTGMFTQVGAGYLHPACAVVYLEDPTLGDRLKSASPLLNKKDCEEIAKLCDAAAKTAPAPKKKTSEPAAAKPKRTSAARAEELVFADQLIEKGDPRGELIVVESELAESGLETAKGQKLAARAKELAPKALTLWKKELGLGGTKTSFELESGLPSKVPVKLNVRKAVGDDVVPDHKWIVGYRVHGGSEEKLADLLRHPKFARIRHLLIETPFTWDGWKGFCSCDEVKNLESLEVALSLGPRALHMGLTATKLESLTRLTIGTSFVLEPDLRGFDRVSGLPSLKALHFRAGIMADLSELFLRSPLAKRLEEIGLPAYMTTDSLAGLTLPNLRRLILSTGFMQPKLMRTLIEADLPKLGYLDLSTTNLSSATAMELANKKNLPGLKRLDVSKNPVDAATLDALRARFGDQLIAEHMITPPSKRRPISKKKTTTTTAKKRSSR